jgi:hypothetical protein
MDAESLTFREMIRRLESVNSVGYRSVTEDMHRKLSGDERKVFIRRYSNRTRFNRELQFVSSRRMPAGTTGLYAMSPARLKQLDWFDDDAWQLFRRLMRRPVREGSPNC